MAQEIYSDCGEHFTVWGHYVYFQAGSGGLYRVPCRGDTDAVPLDKYAGYLVVPGDSYVYFQAGGGGSGLWRRACDGSGKAEPLHPECGNLVVALFTNSKGRGSLRPGDRYVYFQAGSNGLYRVPCDGSAKAKQLHPECGENLAVWDDNVYFQAGSSGLYRVPCDGSANAIQLDPNCGKLVVPGDGYVYFQAGSNGGLYRVPCDGSANAKQLDERAGYLAVPGDGYVYFQAGSKGLYKVPCDGSTNAIQLDPNCGHLVVFGDGYVYFQAGNKGLYRVRCDGKVLPATPLDPNCGNLVAAQGYIYFQGNPHWSGLYRLGVAIPSAPPGLKVRIQDEYVVNTILDSSIDHKYNVIKNLLDEASKNSSDTWFLNFTSGGSTGAYPDAVAGRINGRVAAYLKTLAAKKQNRVGTIVMDFPDDNRKTDMIEAIFNYNSASPLAPQDWMAGISDNKKLSEITLPGTHDSCAFDARYASAISRCQNLTLLQQLAAGIRFIDIRCRHFHDKFDLHHGIEYLGLNFDYVLDKCRDFLKAHDRECIIMSVKEEHDAAGNEKTFEEVFDEYVQKDPDLWYLGNTIPTLSHVRGRIVLLRRFYIAPDSDAARHGIDLTAWVNNATFTWPF